VEFEAGMPVYPSFPSNKTPSVAYGLDFDIAYCTVEVWIDRTTGDPPKIDKVEVIDYRIHEGR